MEIRLSTIGSVSSDGGGYDSFEVTSLTLRLWAGPARREQLTELPYYSSHEVT